MLLFNKPLRFITAILIAGLPLFSFSNTNDTIQSTHETHEVAVTESKKVDEKAAIKEQIEEVKAHHVLDGHDFSLFEYDGQPIGFSLPIILWDNGIQFFRLQNSITEKPLPKVMGISTNYITKKYTKQMPQEL